MSNIGSKTFLFGGRIGLIGSPSGPNELWIRPQVDFDIAHRTIRVREAQEPGNGKLYSKYCEYMKKSGKIENTKKYVDPECLTKVEKASGCE